MALHIQLPNNILRIRNARGYKLTFITKESESWAQYVKHIRETKDSVMAQREFEWAIKGRARATGDDPLGLTDSLLTDLVIEENFLLDQEEQTFEVRREARASLNKRKKETMEILQSIL